MFPFTGTKKVARFFTRGKNDVIIEMPYNKIKNVRSEGSLIPRLVINTLDNSDVKTYKFTNRIKSFRGKRNFSLEQWVGIIKLLKFVKAK